MDSQNKMGERESCGEYNGNNAWYFNGTNGTLNNNNKYNSYQVRPALEFNDYASNKLLTYPVPLSEFYPIYRQCRKHKRRKPSQLIFEFNLVRNLARICHQVNNFEYVPERGICFIVTTPKQREVLAADFGDRIVQTYYVREVHPFLEAHHLHKDSYSCRVGKGSLRAVNKLQDYIYMASEGYTKDVWVVSIDIDSFFMSIDTELLAKRLVEFIDTHMAQHPQRELLKYLTRIIYQSTPQHHCIFKSPRRMWVGLPDRKILRKAAPGRGIPIGNVTSQEAANFLTSFYLWQLEAMGYKFVHYTDDTAVVVCDLERWRGDLPIIKHTIEAETHLRAHPDKYYQQHHSKGITTLGYKVRFNRLLLSNRTTHNIKWKVAVAVRKAAEEEGYIYRHKEEFMATVNSYIGLLKWTNGHTLTTEILTQISQSEWAKVFEVHPDKVKIKPYCTKAKYHERQNRKRRRQQTKHISTLLAKT